MSVFALVFGRFADVRAMIPQVGAKRNIPICCCLLLLPWICMFSLWSGMEWMDDTRIRGETDSWRRCMEMDGILGTIKWRDLVQLLSSLRRACIASDGGWVVSSGSVLEPSCQDRREARDRQAQVIPTQGRSFVFLHG